ncbi:MAG: hypothetical protein JZU65_00685 [Chlorobium sp.]|nr:hypothetical protein [Chlorobium sp.]
MKKVFQSRIEKKHGTCMQAAIASLFDMFIEDVPNFIELGEQWFDEMVKFYELRGYDFQCFNPRGDIELTKQALAIDGGVNGYWFAVVPSVNLGPETTHAVIIDKDMNVVHDPNPNNYGHVYKHEDIISIDVVGKGWHVSVDNKLIIEKL